MLKFLHAKKQGAQARLTEHLTSHVGEEALFPS